ncbi:MAG: hypothetical protein ACOC6F_03725, partial [bacterium]
MNSSEPRQPTLTGLEPTQFDEPSDSLEGPSGTIGGDPKLQFSNGYALQLDQVSRILGGIAGREHQSRVTREDLIEDTGFSSVQIKSLCSMAVGMGLIKRISYNLLPFGELVVKHDRFFDGRNTLWACHYRLGSNPRNLVWQR